MPRRSRRWQIELDKPRGWVDPLLRKLEDLKLPPPPYPKRIFVRDDRIFGFALSITERGKPSFIFECRIGGQSKRFAFPGRDLEVVGEARKWAANLALKLDAGTLAPSPSKVASYDEKTLRRVVHDYLWHNNIRSRNDFLARFENHVFPTLGSRPIESLTNNDPILLVDELALKYRFAAYAVARDLNTVGRWYAKRARPFVWPMIPSPLTKKDREPRDRILDDRELRLVWAAAERQGHPHGTLVRFLLFTGLRRTEAAELRRSEVVDGIVRLSAERTKNNTAFVLPLSQAAKDLLAACPEGPHYFVGKRGQPFLAFAHGKAALDKLCPEVGPWILHDLRRTAGSLMQRVGVRFEVIEAALNHTIKGVAGVYQRHNFIEEKTAALEALARLLKTITE